MNSKILDAKLKVIDCVHSSYLTGLQTGSGGNFSSRLDGTDLVVIKPTGFSFIECTVDNLAVVDLLGKQIEGPSKPSSELLTHLEIYKHRKDILGIMHCHSPWSIAYAEAYDDIKSITYDFQKKIGEVPILRTGDRMAITEMDISKMFLNNPKLQAFVHSRHGIFTFGSSLMKARFNAELIVETIQTALIMNILKNSPRRNL